MSSLWTPSGERPVRRTAEPPAGTEGPSPVDRRVATNGPGSAPAEDDRGGTTDRTSTSNGPPGRTPGSTPDQAAAEELDRLRRELLATPAAVVVANHAYGLFELAAIHLSAQPPNLTEARLAVDALGALVDGVGDRLGDVRGALADALAQIRLAFVQVSAAAAGPDPSASTATTEPSSHAP